MDLGLLATFLAVARHRSLTEAARELGLTQPGVSRRVQRLEQELGVTLLERRGDGVALSRAGREVRTYAENALERYSRLRDSLRQGRQIVAGPLRICASTTPGEFLVPDLVSRFAAEHPRVLPEVFTTDSAQVVEEMRERRWDIGFVGARIPSRGLRYEVVAEDEVVLAVPPSHPFALRREVTLEELEGEPFLLREGGSGTLRSVQSILAGRGLGLPRYRMAMGVNSTRAVLSGVERGYGIGWVSSLALGPLWEGRVATLGLQGIPLRRSIYMVMVRHGGLPDAAAAFAQWVRRETRRGTSGRTLDPPPRGFPPA